MYQALVEEVGALRILDDVREPSSIQKRRQHVERLMLWMIWIEHNLQAIFSAVDELRIPELQIIVDDFPEHGWTPVLHYSLVELWPVVPVVVLSLDWVAELVVLPEGGRYLLQLQRQLLIDNATILANRMHLLAGPIILIRIDYRPLRVIKIRWPLQFVNVLLFVLNDQVLDLANFPVPEYEGINVTLAHPAVFIRGRDQVPLARFLDILGLAIWYYELFVESNLSLQDEDQVDEGIRHFDMIDVLSLLLEDLPRLNRLLVRDRQHRLLLLLLQDLEFDSLRFEFVQLLRLCFLDANLLELSQAHEHRLLDLILNHFLFVDFELSMNRVLLADVARHSRLLRFDFEFRTELEQELLLGLASIFEHFEAFVVG